MISALKNKEDGRFVLSFLLLLSSCQFVRVFLGVSRVGRVPTANKSVNRSQVMGGAVGGVGLPVFRLQ